MIQTIIFAIIVLFISPVGIFAGDPPQLSSPSNNSSVFSSALNWQAPSYELYSSNPYRVQVDDDSSFPSSSINKDYYTKNTYYGPVLDAGIWYWRVKAKDSSGNWSDWSSVWSFTLGGSTSTPTPTASPTPSPTTTPSAAGSSTTTSSFSISNSPSQINSDQSFTTLVNLSLPNNPNTIFYLKGAFKKSDSSNYFGQTKVSGSWIKNGSTYSSQLSITTDTSGNWSGNVEIMPDSEDSGFTDSGDYTFKIARYTSSGSGPTWSNESIISITGSKSTSTTQNSSNPTTKPTNTSKPSIIPQRITTQATTTAITKSNYQIASVAGISSSSASPPAKVEVKNQQQLNLAIWIGSILIFAGSSCLGYIYWKKR